MLRSGQVLHDAPLVPVSVHASTQKTPRKPRGPRCCAPRGKDFYLDPSREPRRDVAGTPADDRDGRDDPPGSTDGDGWPAASGAGAPYLDKTRRSSRGLENTDDTRRTARRSHRPGNAVEETGLARGFAPGPAGGTGHGRPSHAIVTIVVWRLLFWGHPRNPDRCERSGFRFSACETHSLTHSSTRLRRG
jgi:hypothetical protein